VVHRVGETETFVIRSRETEWTGSVRWVRVRVHPDPEHLVAAALRVKPWERARDWEGCLGCFQPVARRERFTNGRWETRWPGGYAGILRLARGHITAEIVAHELVHAACQVYRMNVARSIRLESDCGRREEQLAYLYGQLYADMEKGLHP
jgi:hypothetical protein